MANSIGSKCLGSYLPFWGEGVGEKYVEGVNVRVQSRRWNFYGGTYMGEGSSVRKKRRRFSRTVKSVAWELIPFTAF